MEAAKFSPNHTIRPIVLVNEMFFVLVFVSICYQVLGVEKLCFEKYFCRKFSIINVKYKKTASYAQILTNINTKPDGLSERVLRDGNELNFKDER
jgi:hypothetical protein